jgi:hypothetical protein
MPGIVADAVPIRDEDLIARGLVADHLHGPVTDHQPVADLAECGGLARRASALMRNAGAAA